MVVVIVMIVGGPSMKVPRHGDEWDFDFDIGQGIAEFGPELFIFTVEMSMIFKVESNVRIQIFTR